MAAEDSRHKIENFWVSKKIKLLWFVDTILVGIYVA
jgi:hypothetical protein